jgi:hypothetical protein
MPIELIGGSNGPPLGPAPDTEDLKQLVQRIAERIGRSLERSGLISGKRSDAESATSRTHTSRSIRVKSRRSSRCSGIRSPTGSPPFLAARGHRGDGLAT